MRTRGGYLNTQSSIDLPTPASALVVAAHPDDAEFQCGATLAKWAGDGCVVHHLVLTDGSKGTWDAGIDPAELIHRRAEEQRDAALALGATGEVVMLARSDGELLADTPTRAETAAVIRRLMPEVILGHDPWCRYRLHPDHAAAGRIVVDGIVAARDPFFHREQLAQGLEVHRPDALLLFEPDVANHYETVTERDIEAKLAALEAHESQLETTHFYRISQDESPADDEQARRLTQLGAFRRRERQRLTETGATGNTGAAEAFHLITDQL